MPGILAFGAYVPRRRLQRSAIYEANRWFAPGLKGLAKGERAVANWDEDVITMGVEAARDCLGDDDRAAISTILLASTSFPFADRQNAGVIKEALNLTDDVTALDVGGSQKAGASGLLMACRTAGSGPVLAIAAENRKARPASEDELQNGDAAAAFVIGEEDGIARLIASKSISTDFVDHYRTSGAEFDYGWEARWVRDEGYLKLAGAAIAAVLGEAGLDGASVSRLLVGIPANGVAAMLAKGAGIPAAAIGDDLMNVMGSAGSAQPLVLLAHALETAQPGDRLLVVGFGQGVETLLFEVTDAITTARKPAGVSGWLRRRAEDTNYLKHLVFAGQLKLELGKRADFEQKPVLTALYRNRKTVLGLIGGRCTVTGTIQFPRSEISVNQNNPTVGMQEDYALADRPARILTYTSDSLTYTPDPPNYYGMIEFDGGGRMLAEFSDVEAEQVAVGAPMRMMFRVKAHDAHSGFIKYFWKAVPAVGSE